MRSFKKLTAMILSLALTFTMGSACFAQTPSADTPADQQVFVTFVYGGRASGEWVVKGTNVTAPEVPVIAGSTFCGWSSPLTNIQTNQHIYAVYKPDYLGDAAIEAAKAALPTPAISATNVADPNAAPVIALATPIAVSANAAAANNAQMQLLLALLAQQQAGVSANAATPAANTAAPAATAVTPAAASTPAATPAAAATTPAATTTTTAAPAAAAGVVNFTDKDGNAGTFTQAEWNTLLNVYGGSEAVLRKHSLGDLKKVAAYYGG